MPCPEAVRSCQSLAFLHLQAGIILARRQRRPARNSESARRRITVCASGGLAEGASFVMAPTIPRSSQASCITHYEIRRARSRLRSKTSGFWNFFGSMSAARSYINTRSPALDCMPSNTASLATSAFFGLNPGLQTAVLSRNERKEHGA
jgi:hypothetical protein